MIYTHAPRDWDTEGLPYGAHCLCSRCHGTGCSTFAFDFYADKAGDPLVCETCMRVEKYAEVLKGEKVTAPRSTEDRSG